MRLCFFPLLAFLLMVTACAQPNAESPPPEAAADARVIQIENGRQVARSYCGACHALDDQPTSPRNDAPPLRAVLRGYDGSQLLVDFVNGAHVGSPDMPSFNLNPAAAEDLFVYLKAIQSPEN